MKKANVFISLVVAASMLFSGCYGSFELVRAVHKWNGDVSDNKFVQEAIFVVFVILPVYGVCTFADVVILNTVEFWTGSNPMAMKEGEQKIDYVQHKGKKFKVTTTKNQYFIEPEGSEDFTLRFEPEESSWYLLKDGCSEKISELHTKNQRKIVKLFMPDGSTEEVDI